MVQQTKGSQVLRGSQLRQLPVSSNEGRMTEYAFDIDGHTVVKADEETRETVERIVMTTLEVVEVERK